MGFPSLVVSLWAGPAIAGPTIAFPRPPVNRLGVMAPITGGRPQVRLDPPSARLDPIDGAVAEPTQALEPDVRLQLR